MFDFERPNIEVSEISEDKKYGKFVVKPLERGCTRCISADILFFHLAGKITPDADYCPEHISHPS